MMGAKSPSGLGGGDQAKVEEINSLTRRLQELKLKYDNQGVLLKRTDEELRELKTKHRKLRADHDESGVAGGRQNGGEQQGLMQRVEIAEAQQSRLEAAVQRIEYDKEVLDGEVTTLKLQLGSAQEEAATLQSRVQFLEKSLESVKDVALQFEEENKTLIETLRDAEARELELRDSLTAKDEILGSLQSEAQLLGKQKTDMKAARREGNRNRRQLLLLAEKSNRLQADMNTSVINHKRLLEELKSEYEEHAETVRAEWNLDRKARIEDNDKLKQRFENLKLIQFEDKQQLLREQREVVKALQTQFEEYRQTAEMLFESEATKLENKLHMQTEKYEEEIRYIIKAKDQHFDMMMMAKDAKIMNLIEGSDLQRVLVQHEQDLEQLHRNHAEDLEKMRLATEAEQRDTIAELHSQIDSHLLEEDKLRESIGNLETLLEKAGALNQKRLDQMAQRESKHLEDMQGLQDLLQEAHLAKEKLNQEKQDLRHRIVRLKFQAKGDADETLPNLVKCLSLETSKLKAKHEHLLKRMENGVSQNRVLQQQNLILSQQLERVLYYRIKSRFGDKNTREVLSGNTTTKSQLRDLGHGHLRSAIATLQQVLDGPGSSAPAEEADADVDASHPTKAIEFLADAEAPSEVEAGVKVRIPAKLRRLLDADAPESARVDRAEVLELAQSVEYLQRFQQVSAAFASGSLRLPMAVNNKLH
ncbi:Uncharacterized protein SCF082_LOCUS14948, partial [Durusdinium trenchii]